MSMIIDPPVTPFSEPERIRAWIDDLRRLRSSGGLSTREEMDVDQALQQAFRMLGRSTGLHADAAPGYPAHTASHAHLG